MDTKINSKKALVEAVRAATAVGALMRRNLHSPKRANEVTQHDIKLELDVRSQKLIERMLLKAFPHIAILGEEGIAGDQQSPLRWVVDPIDGTVNFAYTIPHACVSIALQQRVESSREKADYPDGYNTLLGVIYDPFCDELWTAVRGQPARLNKRIIHVSQRAKLAEAVVSVGFSKTDEVLSAMLPFFGELAHKVRKIRIMGAAALALSYTASGRFDAYVERGVRLWDIAAGGLILQCAGGEFWHERVGEDHYYRMVASNGLLRRKLNVRW